MRITLCEDAGVAQLYPITTGRPAFSVTCGSYRLLDWISQLGLPVDVSVRPHLRELVKQNHPQLNIAGEEVAGPNLLLNAQLVPSRRLARMLASLVAEFRPLRLMSRDQLAVACIADGQRVNLSAGLCETTRELPVGEETAPLFEHPHDLVRFNCEILAENLEHRLTVGNYRQLQDGLFVGENAQIHESVVVDTSDGPVLVDANASVGPFTMLQGPIHLGERCRVLEHAAIKDNVCLGSTTKIGGEVEASIVEPYTNKQHHGFLGHSYLGSWINLGAGTCNSDLKNTYGRVNMDYQGVKTETDMQFMGCIMGDYAKTAINTSVFTGKVIGVCSMLYGFITENVPSFVNYARIFGQVAELPADVMIATQRRMFSRRSVTQRECDMQLIRDMYELTRPERRLVDEPLTL